MKSNLNMELEPKPKYDEKKENRKRIKKVRSQPKEEKDIENYKAKITMADVRARKTKDENEIDTETIEKMAKIRLNNCVLELNGM